MANTPRIFSTFRGLPGLQRTGRAFAVLLLGSLMGCAAGSEASLGRGPGGAVGAAEMPTTQDAPGDLAGVAGAGADEAPFHGFAGSGAIDVGGTDEELGAVPQGPATTEPGDSSPIVDASPTVQCNPIVGGTSSVVVDGAVRTFDVQMPADASHVALLFVWHGWLQQPGEFANTIVYDVPRGAWVPFDPNAFPMPLLIVTPHDLKLIPPVGLDWDIAQGDKDFPFFEAMLQCVQEQFSVDEERIYSFGFSAGAVFTNLLTARYPDLFAATISESGAWFNDSTQWSDVLVPIVDWQWPDFDPADGGNVLLTQGGPNDFATVISLHSTNQKAMPFLYDHGRTVVNCAHTFGHTLDPDLTQAMYYDYLWAHRRGGPPLTGLPNGFPTQANPVGATSCTFHPAR